MVQKGWIFNILKILTFKILTEWSYYFTNSYNFREMGGKVVQTTWTGGFNFTYRVGPFSNTSKYVV